MNFDTDIITMYKIINGISERSLHKINSEIMHKAELNKILLALLDSYKNMYDLGNEEEKIYINLTKQHKKTMGLIKKIARDFEKEDINYTFFKTIKPFKHTPNDLDIILYDKEDMKKTYNLLKNKNWVALDNDRYGITMYKEYYDINIDLHLEIMVSNLLYLNKNILMDNIMNYFLDDIKIRTLNYEAELITVISHSCYKEHMITFADIINYLYLMKNIDINKFYSLLEKTKTYDAFQVFSLYSNQIIDIVDPQLKLKKYIKKIDNIAFTNVSKVKTIPITLEKNMIFYLMIKKLYDDNYTRASLLRALKESANKEQLNNIIEHFRRETY